MVVSFRFFVFHPALTGCSKNNKKCLHQVPGSHVVGKSQARGESARTHAYQTAVDFKQPSCLEHYTQSKTIPTRMQRH